MTENQTSPAGLDGGQLCGWVVEGCSPHPVFAGSTQEPRLLDDPCGWSTTQGLPRTNAIQRDHPRGYHWPWETPLGGQGGPGCAVTLLWEGPQGRGNAESGCEETITASSTGCQG